MKDAKGHGSNTRGGRLTKPLPGHAFHSKTNAELRYIIKDASEAARASRGLSAYNPNSGKREDTEGKYLDQVNDAASIIGYRDRGGKSEAPADVLASGPKSAPAPIHDSMTTGRHGYNASAVQNAIDSSNRHGRKIGGREAKMIHALLKGR